MPAKRRTARDLLLIAVIVGGAFAALVQQAVVPALAGAATRGKRGPARAHAAATSGSPRSPAKQARSAYSAAADVKPGGIRGMLQAEWRDLALMSSSSACIEQVWNGESVADTDFIESDCSVLDKGFESNGGGFTVGNVQHTLKWQRTTNRGGMPGHSASHAWYWGDPTTFNYGTGFAEGATLTSPTLDTRALAHPSLIFNHYLDAEGFIYDVASVDISTDGGQSFTPIASSYAYAPPAGLPDGTTFGQFQPAVIDLSGYSSANTVLRFGFQCDDSFSFEGWYVDDVCVGNLSRSDQNSSSAGADTVHLGSDVVGSLNMRLDVDQYRFHGTAGQDVRIRSTQDPLVYMSLRSETGPATLAEGSEIRTVLPVTGWYFVSVAEADSPWYVGAKYGMKLRACEAPVFLAGFDTGGLCAWSSSQPPAICP